VPTGGRAAGPPRHPEPKACPGGVAAAAEAPSALFRSVDDTAGDGRRNGSQRFAIGRAAACQGGTRLHSPLRIRSGHQPVISASGRAWRGLRQSRSMRWTRTRPGVLRRDVPTRRALRFAGQNCSPTLVGAICRRRCAALRPGRGQVIDTGPPPPPAASQCAVIRHHRRGKSRVDCTSGRGQPACAAGARGGTAAAQAASRPLEVGRRGLRVAGDARADGATGVGADRHVLALELCRCGAPRPGSARAVDQHAGARRCLPPERVTRPSGSL
jgi:hypothetical protein